MSRRKKLAAYLNAIPSPRRDFPAKDTLLIAGSSRSGTTWLGQVFSSDRKRCLVTEPFHPKMPGLVAAGFGWRTYVDRDRDWPQGRAVFERYLRGRGVTIKLLHRNPASFLTCKQLVIKSVRVTRLLPWIASHFPDVRILFVIRHPCAVISSQTANFAGNGHIGWKDNLNYLEQKLPHLLQLASRLESEEERRALTWALDQHVPLSLSPSSPWVTVSYERLVAEGESELRRVFSDLHLEISAESISMLRKNSGQTRQSSVDHARATVDERLAVWKKRLSSTQIARILSVVDACGIRGFGDDVMPDLQSVGVEAG